MTHSKGFHLFLFFSYRGYGRTTERGNFPLEYWQVLAAKLAFIYAFEVGVLGVWPLHYCYEITADVK